MSKDLAAIEQMYLSGMTLRRIAATEAAGGLDFRTIQKMAVKLGWREKLLNSGVAPKPSHGNTGYLSVKKRKLADSYRVWFSVERCGTKINNVIKPGWTPCVPSPYRSKNEAIAAGAKYFFTGDACKNGHYANRNVNIPSESGRCCMCDMMRRKNLIFQKLDFPEEAKLLRDKVRNEWVDSLPIGVSPYRTKQEARKHGSSTYFTGEPCVRGHLSNRSVAKGNCLTCLRESEVNRKARKGADLIALERNNNANIKAAKRRQAYLDLVAAIPGAVPYKNAKEADAAGSSVYFTGKPCQVGHLTNRHVNNGECVDCADMRRDAYEGRLYNLWFDKEAAYQKARQDAGKPVSEYRSRADAIGAGSNRYFTGIPCHNGHLDDRVILNGNQCASCLEIWSQPKPKGYYGEQERRMREADPIKYAARTKAKRHRRKAAEKSAEGSFTRDEFLDVVDKQDGRCFWCGDKLNGDLHADHYIPLSRGGTNWIDNIVASCPSCNLAKSDNMPWDFAAEIGRTDITPEMVEPRSQCCHTSH